MRSAGPGELTSLAERGLDGVDDFRRVRLGARCEAGEILFGTVDTFLIWRLTGGRVHATDVTNASRTLLYDIREHAWSVAGRGLAAGPCRMT